jgi:hypothetical protein
MVSWWADVVWGNNRCGAIGLPAPAPTCCAQGFHAADGYVVTHFIFLFFFLSGGCAWI